MAKFLTSSIGQKFIQSITGAFLIIFLTLHVTINSFSVIDSFTGSFGAADGLFQKGCDFMALPIVTLMVPILALGFILHFVYAFILTWQNVKARGGISRYEVSSKAKSDSWSARNMFVLGVIILGFIAFHLTQFWAHMQLHTFQGGEEENPYMLLATYFGRWWNLALYLVWFAALWFHLTHGFWSMFQTIGWDNNVWRKRLKVIGVVVVTLIVLGFVSVAINAFIQANYINPQLVAW
jgi:succinate dehydrogenase / fumarate reductase cytochrome b subunit